MICIRSTPQIFDPSCWCYGKVIGWWRYWPNEWIKAFLDGFIIEWIIGMCWNRERRLEVDKVDHQECAVERMMFLPALFIFLFLAARKGPALLLWFCLATDLNNESRWPWTKASGMMRKVNHSSFKWVMLLVINVHVRNWDVTTPQYWRLTFIEMIWQYYMYMCSTVELQMHEATPTKFKGKTQKPRMLKVSAWIKSPSEAQLSIAQHMMLSSKREKKFKKIKQINGMCCPQTCSIIHFFCKHFKDEINIVSDRILATYQQIRIFRNNEKIT